MENQRLALKILEILLKSTLMPLKNKIFLRNPHFKHKVLRQNLENAIVARKALEAIRKSIFMSLKKSKKKNSNHF